jgi:hypothetical protein
MCPDTVRHSRVEAVRCNHKMSRTSCHVVTKISHGAAEPGGKVSTFLVEPAPDRIADISSRAERGMRHFADGSGKEVKLVADSNS